ncbi:MAG: hypothetical protein ACI4UU_01520 [Clostridia bacterium]
MDEEQNNEQSLGEKVGNDIQDTTNLVKDGTNLAKDIGTGNVLGIAKDSFNLLKNKKFWLILGISISLPIILIIALASFVHSTYDTIANKVQETTAKITEFYELDKNTGIITIDDDQIDEIIDAMEEIGIDLDELNLMGDVDYTDPEIEKENREALRKYVRKFYEAQASTQTVYPKPDWLDKLFHIGDTYGSVYIHRTKGEQEIEPKSKETLLEYIPYAQIKQIAEGGTQRDIWEIRRYYSIDEQGKLVIPYWTTSEVNGVVQSVKISLKSIDYKNSISQYTTSMNFFFYLAMISRNPEFVSAVADMAKTAEIHLTIIDNENKQTETEKYYETKNWKIGPKDVYGPDGERLDDIPAERTIY